MIVDLVRTFCPKCKNEWEVEVKVPENKDSEAIETKCENCGAIQRFWVEKVPKTRYKLSRIFRNTDPEVIKEEYEKN